MADEKTSEQPLLGLDLVFEAGQSKIEAQLESVNSLDVKMGVLIAFLGALVAGLLAVLLGAEPAKAHALLNPSTWFGWILIGLLALDAVLIAVALITSFNAFRPRNFTAGVKFEDLFEWTNEEPKNIKYAFLPTVKEGIKRNGDLLTSKQESAKKAAWFTLGALLVLLITAAAIVLRLKAYS